MKKYKAAVIGCGRIGAEERRYDKKIRPATHAAGYKNHPRIELAALVDIDKKKLKEAAKFFPGAQLFSEAKAMLEKIKPDIVSVATHPGSHLKFVKMASEFGAKAIICEKPMAESMKEAESMVKICQKKKVLLFVAHLRHFDPLTLKYNNFVKAGKIGKVLQANCHYYNGFLNNGAHIIDMLISFLGGVNQVNGVYNLETSNPEKDRNIDATIYFKNKSRAILQSLKLKNGLTDWSFYGDEGELAIKNLGYEINFKNSKIGKARSFIEPMISHVVLCLDKKEKPMGTGKEALPVLQALLAIKKSADNKSKIIKIN